MPPDYEKVSRVMHAPAEQMKFDRDHLDDLILECAREDFGLFRSLIRPKMIHGWWTQEVAWQLQRFYNEMIAGTRPKLAIAAPPQHGKSWAVTDFIAYVAGKAPDKKTISGSFSDDLGVRTNSGLQRILMSDSFKRMFPDTRISEENYEAAGRWKRNSSLIEYVNHEGSFRNTTVAGQINGMELHLGVIDDPLKGRAEAHSPTMRNKAWEWFADDFLSRFAKDGALLIVMTRWHVDDILGRYIHCATGSATSSRCGPTSQPHGLPILLRIKAQRSARSRSRQCKTMVPSAQW
jgi:Terminase large subunit, T4likevirus-type, N-terminal